MKDFIIRDYEKFKIQILELFCYFREFSEQFNSQTFLTMCLWSCLGIVANIFYLSNIINTRAIQEIYEVIFWIGWGLYLFLLIIFISLRLNVFKLSYLQKVGVIVITSILLLMSIFNTSKMIPVSFSYQGKIHWSVEISLYSELFILVAIIFFSYGINKLFSNTNLDTINGIKLDNTVIDVLWGERNDLTPEQMDLIDSVIEKIEQPIFVDIVKSTIIDSLRFNGRSTLRQWNLFNIYWSFLFLNCII